MQTTTTGTGTGSSVATDETTRLIASDKVEGTAVYNRQGERHRIRLSTAGVAGAAPCAVLLWARPCHR